MDKKTLQNYKARISSLEQTLRLARLHGKKQRASQIEQELIWLRHDLTQMQVR